MINERVRKLLWESVADILFEANKGKIRKLRETTGLTQLKFGLEVNISQDTLSNWENGRKKPSSESMIIFIPNFLDYISRNEDAYRNICKLISEY